jgi:hypothetical protein
MEKTKQNKKNLTPMTCKRKTIQKEKVDPTLERGVD